MRASKMSCTMVIIPAPVGDVVEGLFGSLPNSFGSLAMLLAMRRASSTISTSVLRGSDTRTVPRSDHYFQGA
jgi:hypothetical protein